MMLVTGEGHATRADSLAGHAMGDLERHYDAVVATRDADEPLPTGTGAIGFSRRMAECSASCVANPSFRRAVERVL